MENKNENSAHSFTEGSDFEFHETGVNVEKITNEFEHEMKEFAHWVGGWNELRKIIDRLEDEDNEAAFYRATSGASDAWDGGFAENH